MSQILKNGLILENEGYAGPEGGASIPEAYRFPSQVIELVQVTPVPQTDKGDVQFDYETERTVYVRPVVKDARILPKDRFYSIGLHVGKRVEEVSLWDLEADAKGNPILDEKGRPKVKTEWSTEENRETPLRWKLEVSSGEGYPIQLPAEKWKLQQLWKDPYNSSVRRIPDGGSVYPNPLVGMPGTYYIHDVHTEEAQRKQRRKGLEEAKAYLRSLDPKTFEAYASFLRVEVEENYDEKDLELALEDFVRNEPAYFLKMTRDNKSLGNDMLWHLALRERIIKDKGGNGVWLATSSGPEILIGPNKAQALGYLIDNASAMEEVVAVSGFDKIAEFMPGLHPEVSAAVSSGNRMIQDDLKKKDEEIAELKRLVNDLVTEGKKKRKDA